jgi:uncharacterized protein (DUF1697 family)
MSAAEVNMPTCYVSLLRGVNLGPATQLPMPRLKQLYVDLGLHDVATYIRSGNVVFRSDDGPDALRERIESGIEQRLGMSVDVVVRSHDDLAGVVARNPFPRADPGRLAVVFLSAPVPEELTRRLEATDFGTDEYAADGREIYLHLPNGFGRSKLAARMSALRSPVVGTVRNWRTVGKLIDMSR